MRLVLPGRSSEQVFPAAAHEVPHVGIDLVNVSGAVSTKVELAPCVGGSLGRAEREFPGSKSFILPRDWHEASAGTLGCYRVTATAQGTNGPLETGSITILRGDNQIDGKLLLPDGVHSVVVAGTEVTAWVERLRLTAKADGTGAFSFLHVPSGRLLRLEARLGPDRQGMQYRGDIATRVSLDGSTPSVRVELPLALVPPLIDAQEPDDTLEQMAGQPPVPAGTHQSRTLASRLDVDLVPVKVEAGKVYRFRASLTGPRQGEIRLGLISNSGQELKQSTPGASSDEQWLVFQSKATALLYLRIDRADQEPIPSSYTLDIFHAASSGG